MAARWNKRSLWIQVSGAGVDEVNGLYEWRGSPPQYYRHGYCNNPSRKQLISWDSDRAAWIIARHIRGSDNAGDIWERFRVTTEPFYQVGHNETDNGFPPQENWIALDSVPEPAPSVSFVLPLLPARLSRMAQEYFDQIEKEVPPNKQEDFRQQVSGRLLNVQSHPCPLDLVVIERMFEQNRLEESRLLLQLAVWKANALLQMELLVPMYGYFDVMEWMMEGWKAKKASVDQSKVMMIVKLVQAFLKPHKKADSEVVYREHYHNLTVQDFKNLGVPESEFDPVEPRIYRASIASADPQNTRIEI